jgi:hypothetical protein
VLRTRAVIGKWPVNHGYIESKFDVADAGFTLVTLVLLAW